MVDLRRSGPNMEDQKSPKLPLDLTVMMTSIKYYIKGNVHRQTNVYTCTLQQEVLYKPMASVLRKVRIENSILTLRKQRPLVY